MAAAKPLHVWVATVSELTDKYPISPRALQFLPTTERCRILHLVTVYAHPTPGTYSEAVLDSFEKAFTDAGHSIDRIDLYSEEFDPRFTPEDHDHYCGGPVPPSIAKMHRRVEAADRLAFVFPVYWWGMPAMMKGWIDRVFTPGWAFDGESGEVDYEAQDQPEPLLPRIPTAVIGTGATAQRTYHKYGYREAMRTQIDVGTLAYCGLTDVESHLVYAVEGEDNTGNRGEGLAQASAIAREFLSDSRAVRNVRDEHLAVSAPRS